MAQPRMKDDAAATRPELKDRSVGLVVFGSASVLIGLCCALLIPLTVLSVALSGSIAGAGVDSRSAWSACAMYAFMAVAFVWLGVGSIRARRWACELLLSLSWIWLLTGVCSLIVGVLVVPVVVAQLGAGSALPREVTAFVVAVTFAVIAVLYVVLPGLFVLFYRSPSVAATCRAHHPEREWVDGYPRRLLTLTVVWSLLAASALVMPAYNYLFPLFGLVLTGLGGAFLWALVLAVCVALAFGTSRRAPWAWWGGVALTLVAAVSSMLTALRFDMAEISSMMALSEEQAAMMNLIPMLDRWVLISGTVVVWGTFLAYLMTLRKYFIAEAIESDV
jgi:hypothetical protein